MSVSATVMEMGGERLWVVVDGSGEDAGRVAVAVALHEQGLPLRTIARFVGRSHTWVHQRVRTHRRERGGDAAPLSTREEGEN